MEKTLKKALKTRTISQEDLAELLKYLNLPENKERYYINENPKENRIGKYYLLVENPHDLENSVNTKLYLKENDKDEIVYKIKYYEIISDQAHDDKKAMQLYLLQKNIEFAYNKELKDHKITGEYKELSDLLEKVKKARSYFTFKRFLKDNSSDKHKKKSDDIVGPKAKAKK